MTKEMVKTLKGNIMSKLYNMGCSFAYGNCAKGRNILCDEHRSPGTYIAEYLNIHEVNLARNGFSIDGVLRRVYTTDFEKDSVVLIGVPPSGRFQVVSFDEQVYNKERGSKASIFGKNSEAENCIRHAFTKGPTIKGDYFHTLKYTAVPGVDDINETASYNVLFSVLKIQERLKKLGLKYYIYNSMNYGYNPKNKEINKIKDQIDWSNYYKPEWSMFDLIKSNVEYELADGDQHPNHLAYEKWSIDFIDWLENK